MKLAFLGLLAIQLWAQAVGAPSSVGIGLGGSGSGGGGTPGGSDTQCQYNNAGSFGGITGCTTNGTIVTLTNPAVSGTLLIGTTISLNGTTGAGAFGVAGTTGAVSIKGSTSGTFTETVNAIAGTWSWTWPATAGTNHQWLETDGSGVAAWSSKVLAGNGAVGAPTLSFVNFATSGFWTDATTNIFASVGGTKMSALNTSGLRFLNTGSICFTSDPGVASCTTGISESSSGVLAIGASGTAGAVTGALLLTRVQTSEVQIGNLGTCDASHAGDRQMVNNSNAASFTAGIGAVVASGGTTHVPVVCDGTNWRIG